MTSSKHTATVLNYLRSQASEVILFYSGGKDSLVLLDLMAPYFDKIYCVLMEFVPDLLHLKPFMTWVNRYKNAEIIKMPHWMTAYYMHINYYSMPRPGNHVKAFKQVDIERAAKQKTGCEWIVFGHKQADSLNRRLMLRGYKFEAINEKGKKIYPLSTWNKQQVKSYITIKKLIKPVEYGGKNSNGLDLNKDVFLWLQKHHPQDLEKIFKVFPLSRQILFEHEQQQ